MERGAMPRTGEVEMRLTAGDVKHIQESWRSYWDPASWDSPDDTPDGPDVIMLSVGYVHLHDDDVWFGHDTVATLDSDGDVTWYRGEPLTDDDLEGLSDAWVDNFGEDPEERAPLYVMTSIGDGWMHRDRVVIGDDGDVYATFDDEGNATRI
jgi:hypothetical protein